MVELGERDRRREPFNRSAITRTLGGCDKHLVASVMLKGWADVEAVDTMRSKGSSLRRGVVKDDTRARNRQRSAVEIEVPKETSISRQFWLTA